MRSALLGGDESSREKVGVGGGKKAKVRGERGEKEEKQKEKRGKEWEGNQQKERWRGRRGRE